MDIPFIDSTLKLFKKVRDEIDITLKSLEILSKSIPDDHNKVQRKSRYIYYYLMKEFCFKLNSISNVKFFPNFITILVDGKTIVSEINDKLLYQIDTTNNDELFDIESPPSLYIVKIDGLCEYRLNAKIEREIYSEQNNCIELTTNKEALSTVKDTIYKLKNLSNYTYSIKNAIKK